MALFWLIATPGEAHVCSILNTEGLVGGATQAPLTQAEMDELQRKRCERPPSPVAILVFGNGYAVIIGLFAVWAERRSEGSSDDPLVPRG